MLGQKSAVKIGALPQKGIPSAGNVSAPSGAAKERQMRLLSPGKRALREAIEKNPELVMKFALRSNGQRIRLTSLPAHPSLPSLTTPSAVAPAAAAAATTSSLKTLLLNPSMIMGLLTTTLLGANLIRNMISEHKTQRYREKVQKVLEGSSESDMSILKNPPHMTTDTLDVVGPEDVEVPVEKGPPNFL